MSEIDDYLAKLPDDRRDALKRVRAVVKKNLPRGYQEGIQYGCISWFVPTSKLAQTYNGQPLMYAGIASKKAYMTLHLVGVYGDPKLRKWFEAAYKKSGKKLDMGAGCVRFKTLDALALDVVGQVIAKVPVDDYVAAYHKAHARRKKS